MNTERASRPVFRSLVVAALFVGGCGSYPEVSPAAFELAKAVDNLCNLQAEAQLPTAREHIETAFTDGRITDDERRFLVEILDAAAGGDWERAQQMARQLLTDQQQPT